MKTQRSFFLTIFLALLFVLCTKKETSLFSQKYENLTIESIKKLPQTVNNLNIEKIAFEEKKFTSYIASYFSDGYKLYARVDIPKGTIPKNGLPVVIVNHGYIPPEKYSTEKSYHYVASFFANNGFITLKPDYRGHDKSEGRENGYLNRLSYPIDVINLINCIPNIKEADKNNIFMLGHSMGGMVTLIVLETDYRVKAASLWASVSIDFPENGLYFLRKRDQNLAKEVEEIAKKEIGVKNYAKFSPFNYIDQIIAPLIIHHGTDDESVPYNWSLTLVEKLKSKNKTYDFFTYKGEDHNFTKGSFYVVLKRDLDFFKKHISK